MSPSRRLEVVEEHAMPASLDHAIREMLCECFPDNTAAFARTRAWHGSAPAYSVVSRSHDGVFGHVGVVVREVNAGGRAIVVAGIQNMAVVPSHRGTGLSHRLMAEAMAEARRRGIPFGLLFCIPKLERVYGAMGWETLPVRARMVFEGKETEIPPKNIAMALPLAGKGFPGGELHLGGADW